jgi:hypothetical protein
MSGRVFSKRVVEEVAVTKPVVEDEVVKHSLPAAILVQLLDKVFSVPQRDILGEQIAFAVKQALKQVAHDYDLEYQDLKDKYLTEGVTEGVAPSPPKAVKKTKPKAKTEAPAQIQAAAAKPALSKMKKDDLVKECDEFGISSEGTVPQLRERLKGARAGTLAPAPEAPPAPKKKAAKKKKSDKKEKPVHTHTLQEEPVDGCGVCETYGNIAGGKDDDDDFEEAEEAGLSIKERLKRLLATHGAAEDEPNDEDDPEYDPDREDGEL